MKAKTKTAKKAAATAPAKASKTGIRVRRAAKPKTAAATASARKVSTATAAKPAAKRKTATAKPKAARKKPTAPLLEALPPILLEGDVPPAPAVAGPGQRYALGPEAPPAHLPGGEPGELPEAYGTKQLFLVARDPHWVYAFWDLTSAQQRQYNRRSADRHLVLRVYENALAGTPCAEARVHPESRNWFVHVGKGGAKYLAELGYYDARRNWTRIAASKATLTPPDTLSEDTTARFATMPPDLSFEAMITLLKQAALEHRPLAEAIQEIAAVASAAAAAAEAGVQPAAFAPAPEAGPAAWTPEQEKALARLISVDAVRRVWIGSLEITELLRRQLVKELASQAAVPAPALPPGQLGSLSSPIGGAAAAARAKGFWFNVNAELIIYGATEPDAAVRIAGRPIQLRPDGSFTCRFALPDGQFDLPVTAESADQTEGRMAGLKFSRQTEYRGAVGVHPQDPALRPPLPANVPPKG